MKKNIRWDFSGHTVLVSGGARGIGRSVVRQFARAGANVVCGDKDIDGFTGTANLLDCEAGNIEFVECDFSDLSAWGKLHDRAKSRGWTPTTLVANVGIGMRKDLTEMEIVEFERVQRINVTSALAGVLQVLPSLQKSGGQSSIVFLSSTMTRCIFSGHAGYTISKSALVGMTRALAIELAEKKIRVNCVLPGFVAIGHLRDRLPRELWDEFDEEFASEFDEIYAKLQPLSHCIRPDDISDAILFLASDNARAITGTEMVVDGGLWLQAPTSPSALKSTDLSTPAIEAWIEKKMNRGRPSSCEPDRDR